MTRWRVWWILTLVLWLCGCALIAWRNGVS